ncbi:MAG TPA: hypothetical protein VGU01_03370 [Sphingomicrobium sp.]|nr:hypothetical protein [Sphingomicrobium sp.]
MHFRKSAALALIAVSSPLAAQTVPDLTTATPIAGEWAYNAISDGSEARFIDTNAVPQLILSCARSTRHVTVAKAAASAAPYLIIWTSSQQRIIPSSYNPAAGRLLAELDANDPILDAMATSRGRIGVGTDTQPSLVVPPWPELARVIEDCRV